MFQLCLPQLITHTHTQGERHWSSVDVPQFRCDNEEGVDNRFMVLSEKPRSNSSCPHFSFRSSNKAMSRAYSALKGEATAWKLSVFPRSSALQFRHSHGHGLVLGSPAVFCLALCHSLLALRMRQAHSGAKEMFAKNCRGLCVLPTFLALADKS